MDRRFLSLRHAPVKVQTRAEGDETRKTIVGYAAVFYRADQPGSEYWIFDDFVERILPGAFDRAIAEDDVRALFNHDPNYLLGRSTADTLRLSSDETGLRYEIDPPDTQAGRDVLTSIDRQDLSGSSFAFVPESTVWREESRDGKDVLIREIESVRLYDVGPVTYPAYDATTTGLRSIDDAKEASNAVAEYRKQQAEEAARRQRIACRARLVELGIA